MIMVKEELDYPNVLLISSKYSGSSEKRLPLPSKLFLLINLPCTFAILKED